MSKEPEPVAESRATTGQPKHPRRYRKGVGLDRTNPHSHGYKAKGGPIERRFVSVQDEPEHEEDKKHSP